MRIHRHGLLTGAALLVAALAGVAGSLERGSETTTQATMRRIFADVRVLLPLSASNDEFRAERNQERIRSALEDLAGRADQVAGHVPDGGVRFQHLGQSLARDARDALRTYESGHPEHAQFLIQQLTENCVACHTGLPSPGDSPLAEGFLADVSLAKLSPLERSRIQMATRRFDDALATFERLLAARRYPPAELIGPLTDYLTIAIRVKRDFERPVPVLQRFAERPDLWRYLRLDVEHWIGALRSLPARSGGEPSVGQARTLLSEARELIRFPADRRALVHYIVASSILQRYTAAHPTGPESAEAYYMLGLIESRIGRNEWVSQAGVFLEASIRLEPRGRFAETAYATLEEETLLDYGGSLGEPLPPDVAANLAELRRLIDTP